MELLIIAVFCGAIFFIGRTLDVRNWNRGICKESGKPWKLFDIASDGSRGYKDGTGNYIWISHSIDRPE